MPPAQYRSVVGGRLSERFGSTFGDVSVAPGRAETELTADIADQSQLYGILTRLRDLGIELVSVNVCR